MRGIIDNPTFCSRSLYGNRFLARIDENWHTHLHSMCWHSTMDEKITTWICTLTPPMTHLGHVKNCWVLQVRLWLHALSRISSLCYFVQQRQDNAAVHVRHWSSVDSRHELFFTEVDAWLPRLDQELQETVALPNS